MNKGLSRTQAIPVDQDMALRTNVPDLLVFFDALVQKQHPSETTLDVPDARP